MSLSYVTVDVFTTSKFAGNQLAIVHLSASTHLSQEQKQAIAKEFNYQETVFIHDGNVEETAKNRSWTIDIFTTSSEIPFAGHPTIGTACYLLGSLEGSAGEGDVVHGTLIEKAGKVPLEYNRTTHRVSASIPHNVRVHSQNCSLEELGELEPQLKKHLKASPVVSIVKGMTFVLIELESTDVLGEVAVPYRGVKVDMDEGWEGGVVALYFYVRLEDEGDGITRLRTRMVEGSFVGEDAATGSAACDLCSYLSMQSGNSGEVNKFEITQGVEMGRRSDIELKVTLDEGKKVKEVRLGGSAVKVTEGKLFL
jgi:PhzF family phenazine biosynthesis protein